MTVATTAMRAEPSLPMIWPPLLIAARPVPGTPTGQRCCERQESVGRSERGRMMSVVGYNGLLLTARAVIYGHCCLTPAPDAFR